MNTRSAMLTLALAVVGLFSLAAQAQGPATRPGGDGPRGPEGGLQKALADLNLTADQEAKVKTIMAAHHQAMENFLKEHGEEFKALEQKIKAARDANSRPDKDDMEAMKKLHEQRKEIMDSMLKQLSDVLTKEQMEKFQQALPKGGPGGPGGPGGAGPMGPLSQLDLSDAQKEKVRAILADARKAAEEATTPEAKRAAFEAAMAKIKSDVLTPDQAKKFDDFQKEHPRPDGAGPRGEGGTRPAPGK